MHIKRILAGLRKQRRAIDKAIEALEHIGNQTKPRMRQPRVSSRKRGQVVVTATKPSAPRHDPPPGAQVIEFLNTRTG